MRCLETMVNGQPHSVAGRDDALVCAGVSWDVDFEHLTRRMKVSVTSVGFTAFERWGADECFLRLGDVVTVRVVERDAADAPAWRSTETSPTRMAPPDLFQSTSHGVVGELLLWLGLIFGAVAILLFG